MLPDDELCLCFHITRRKVENYVRIECPRAASQLSDCGGAGTGCGWCRPFLQKIFDAANQPESTEFDLPTPEEYATGRAGHIKSGKGTPPGGG